MKLFTTLLAYFCFISSLFAAPPTVASFLPTSAAPGMSVVITGSNFSTATAVSIGGTSASFIINSATQITAVVPVTASGAILVTNPDGSGNRAGFIYVPTSGIVTDFGGFWSATGALPNPTQPDNSHNLLAFTHNNIMYSTGVNNSILTNNGLTYTPGNFKALPVASITGISGSTGSTFIALARRVDGSSTSAYVPGASSYTIKSSLTDGINGLDLGTGITNLPNTAIMTFQIYNINSTKITDAEPDIILTQIASPSVGNDVFTFVDASGNTVGNAFTQDMTLLPRFGTYVLDLFTLPAGLPYNTARPTGVASSGTNTTRDIRVVALRLSDCGITAANYQNVKGLRIAPSGNSDYAFIGYNAASINLPPNVDISTETSTLSVCSGGSAILEAIGAAAAGGALSFSWQESTDNGVTWNNITNGGNYSGAASARLTVANAVVGRRYRAVVNEVGNGNPGTSDPVTITAATGTPPSAVSVTGAGTSCLNTSVQLSASVTGGTNLTYQWQTNASGSFADVSGATSASYYPATTATGTTGYRVLVANGSGCPGAVTSGTSNVVINGISSVTPAERCETGTLTLSATATASPISWYTVETGGTAVDGASFTTPSINATTTYYVAAPGCAGAGQRVPVVATVHRASTGGSVIGAAEVITGTNSTTLTLGSNTGNVVSWQSSTDTFNVVTNSIANSGPQYTVNNLTQNTQYRVLVQSGTCATSTSAVAYMRVTGTLPFRDNSLQLSEQNSGVLLQWQTYDQSNALGYTVERSEDGIQFSQVGSVSPDAGNSAKYQWLDQQVAGNVVYYRIKETLVDGRFSYSNTQSIKLKRTDASLRVYPNPVQDGSVKLHFAHAQAGRYTVTLHNVGGQKVVETNVQHSGNAAAYNVLTRNLQPGVYWLKVEGPSGFRKRVSLVIQ